MTTFPCRLRRTGRRLLLGALAATLLAAAPAAVPALSGPLAGPAAAARPAAPALVASPMLSPEILATTAPPAADASARRYSEGLAASSVGQLLSPDNSCTATVVASDSGRVAVTAAHCVYVPRRHDAFVGGFNGLPPGWVEGLQFQPGRIGDSAPYGTWAVEQMWVDKVWQETGDARYDVAFLRLAELDGRTVQDVVGAQGMAFGTEQGRPAVSALGYPAEAPFDGTTLRRCSTPAAGTEHLTSTGVYAMACRMTPGSSGGPWMSGFDAADGTGTIVAVTSLLTLDDSQQFYGAALDRFARTLHRSADRGA